MSFVEGIKAIPGDILSLPTPAGRFRRAGEIGKILVDELTGVIKTIPYGIRALRQHKKLPDALVRGDNADLIFNSVSIARNVRYAYSPRAVMDVYLPRGVSLSDEFAQDEKGRVIRKVMDDVVGDASGSNTTSANTTGSHNSGKVSTVTQRNLPPIALFIHGGVWAVGERWQFAPMAHRLAEEGIVTCVATYTLFPDAKCDTMWEEVSDAVTWTMDNAQHIGGDASNVVLVGHSAGAQICAMTLMHRQGLLNDDAEKTKKTIDTRQPQKFLGLCGVYDIQTHFDYEDSRGVAQVSTMARAMGGLPNFEKCSPLQIVRNNADTIAADFFDKVKNVTTEKVPNVSSEMTADTLDLETDAMRRTDWAPMGIMDTDENISIGEIVAESVAKSQLALATKKQEDEEELKKVESAETEFNASNASPDMATGLVSKTSASAVFAQRRNTPPPGPAVGAFAGDEAARQAGYTAQSTSSQSTSATPRPGCFPPSYLFAGCADTTVPWFESAEYHLALTDAGAKSRMLLYLKEPHASFVLGWNPRKEGKKNMSQSAETSNAAVSTDTFWNDDLSDPSSGLAPHCTDIVRVIKSA